MPHVRPGGGEQRVISVTGMHRSGTSLAARAVNLLGVSFGAPETLLPPGPDNVAGYWENRAMKELDDELLARLGGSWDQPPVLRPGWAEDPRLDDLLVRACDIADGQLLAGGAPVVGCKDPRLSLVAPFWRRAVAIDATVVVVRDPLEVAESLRVRNGLGPAEAGTLWLRYLLAALADAPRAVIVSQRELVADLSGTLVALAAALALPAPGEAALAAAADHLDAGLVHHVAPGEVPGDVDPVLALAHLVWHDGAPDPSCLPAAAIDALAQGWLGPPGNREALAAARAEAVDLRERLRRRLREVRAADAAGGDEGGRAS